MAFSSFSANSITILDGATAPFFKKGRENGQLGKNPFLLTSNAYHHLFYQLVLLLQHDITHYCNEEAENAYPKNCKMDTVVEKNC